jgi:choline dehydrogenase-like flavoprotein
MKKVVMVGSGAGGAMAARELALRGFEVLVVEKGKPFKPFTRHVGLTEPLRRVGLMGGEGTATRIFPALEAFRSSDDLILVRGITSGGCTSIACANIVRAEYGLAEIGLDLKQEYEEIESLLKPRPVPRKRWRPTTQRMFDAAAQLGLDPHPTPKAISLPKCVSCGLCELGCASGAKWDSRRLLDEAEAKGAKMMTGAAVERVNLKNGVAAGVTIREEGQQRQIEADVVVLAAGGIGTAQILRASDLPASDKLWVDIVLTVGGRSEEARQLNEVPMVWFSKQDHYILSPYLDILSHWFHKPWRNVSLRDRVGLMIKIADTEVGAVLADGTVHKALTEADHRRLDGAVAVAGAVMETSGVSGPYVNGAFNGGHFGGTVPLSRKDVLTMRPASLPEGLWVADLSLLPTSQGLPAMLTASALALRVARTIPSD